MFKKYSKKNGISLVEMVTVLAVVGIFIGVFYTVFLLNWQAFDQYIARADFSQDLDTIVDGVASDGRFAKQIDLVTSPAAKQANFFDPDGKLLVQYTMSDTGEFIANRGANDQVITSYLDFANSSFVKQGKAVVVTIAMSHSVFGHPTTMHSSTEIYPRN